MVIPRNSDFWGKIKDKEKEKEIFTLRLEQVALESAILYTQILIH